MLARWSCLTTIPTHAALRPLGFNLPAISIRSPTGTGTDSNTRSFPYSDTGSEPRHNALDSYSATLEDVPSPSTDPEQFERSVTFAAGNNPIISPNADAEARQNQRAVAIPQNLLQEPETPPDTTRANLQATPATNASKNLGLHRPPRDGECRNRHVIIQPNSLRNGDRKR